MAEIRRKTVSKLEYLDRIEADWRRTLGVNPPAQPGEFVFNTAVSIIREPLKLTVVNDGGDTIIFIVKG